jgi:hypothetical protein
VIPPASFAGPRMLWLALGALALVGMMFAAAIALVDRMRQPEGSGLIVVQAPTANTDNTTQHTSAAPPLATAPLEATVEPPMVDDSDERPAKRTAAAKARKSASSAEPLQLMAAGVAEAFSKQKAGVISCLNQHPEDLQGAPQLEVRLQVDRNGVASDAALLPATMSNKPVASCLKTAIKQMTFPRPEQPTTFRVPLLWRRK